MGVSGRQLAALIGVSETAVRKAEKAGRIKRLPDGTYDPEAARAAWGKNTDPAFSRVRTVREPAHPVPIATEDDAREAVSLISRVLQEEGGEAVRVVDFEAARTAETILKARQRDLQMSERRKELVPLSAVKGHIEKAFIGYRQAVQRLPSRFAAQIAAEAGCEAGALDAALSRAIATVLDELSAPVVRT